MITFVMLFTVYIPMQNLSTQIFSELDYKYLGELSVLFVYTGFCLMSLIAANLI